MTRFKWTEDDKARLLACSDRDDMLAEFPELSLENLERRKREFLNERFEENFKVLYIDIETAPNTASVWGLWNQNVSLNQLLESGRTICFAAKWQGKRQVHFYSDYKHGQSEMIAKAHELLSQADVVVHYNGKRFDIPTLNKEFLLEKLTPPSPYQQIDLYSVVKQKFRFPSYKLDYVVQELGLGTKVHHSGHEMWLKCIAGDADAWADMERYNKQDTLLLEDLHATLLPWITTHPNRRLFESGVTCPNCGNKGDLRREGFSYTQTGRYQRYQCRTCGTWLRDNRRVSSTKVRSTVL